MQQFYSLILSTGVIAENTFLTLINKRDTAPCGYSYPGKELMINSNFYASKEDLEDSLMKEPGLWRMYNGLDINRPWKERFVDFMTGRKTLPLTYDPFFKFIFSPDAHPQRLEELLSAIIGVPVKVQSILPAESMLLSNESLIIMDIIVRLSDGSLANVEIQKIPYGFPAERMSCYSADLLLRQYDRLNRGSNFSYSSLKKVYTIVIFEKSTKQFHDEALCGAFLHHGKAIFNTGLPLELLQEYFIISLDVFRENSYAKYESSLVMWLSFLTTESTHDMDFLIRKYPHLEEVYAEITGYMSRKGEILNMFSEALSILDKNTIHYMIEELQEQIAAKDATIADKDAAIADKDAELSVAMTQLKNTETEGIKNYISAVKAYAGNKENAINDVISKFGKTEKEACELVEKYW